MASRPSAASTKPIGEAPTSASFGGAPEFATADLVTGAEIVKGRFKSVFGGTLKGQDGTEDRDTLVTRYSKAPDVKQELNLLALLSRQGPAAYNFVPEIYGARADRREIVILQERARHGSLKESIGGGEGAPLEHWTEDHKLFAAMHLAEAMVYLESLRVVHADMSCRNMVVARFVDEDPSQTLIKVTEFGLAVVLKDGADHIIQKQPMATRWCPPEQMMHNKMSHRTDVWSFGTTLWELFSDGQSPWMECEKRPAVAEKLTLLAELFEKGDQAQESAVIRDGFPIPDDCCDAAYDAILSCLRVDEARRPTFANLRVTFKDLADPTVKSTRSLKSARSVKSTKSLRSQSGDVPVNSTMSAHRSLGALSKGGVDADAAFESRCGDLREFLSSAGATEMLGEAGALEALKAFLLSKEAQSIRAAAGWSSTIPGLSAPEVFGRPVRDVVMELSSSGRQPMMQPGGLPGAGVPQWPGAAKQAWADDAWVVQSMVAPTLLRRQEFMDPESAWAAYNEVASTMGCRLRSWRGLADSAGDHGAARMVL
mmetsp:Transcript_30200/g.87025  ORF Transcript_30200/g.87025 Transcript_30200/m.87025 type:complete len:541 (+) Transcript_30200:52-1674(+)|eukprot:CAMPEP_0176017010 /NCGR_PEP_ID=MMETSP0120_2-20121206/8143_1 /TAXON_ID=160619 /ORGANISM="Kryptoperidinium foliaceum, Strain CCMP 1326" /LENGTH=540 /DNA_ID=CAMNT_0017350019 /DNA_START=46 /DNA_END=1668 /DNA_ORIENTATION=+